VPSEGEPARRGRPRDTAVDQRVLNVAWDLLVTGGYAGLNVDEVAERAAVAKTTLYRRWPTKDHLAIAVVTRTIPPTTVPDTGDLRHDLTEFAVGLATNLHRYRMARRSDGVSAGLAGELVAATARHPDLGDLVRALHGRRHAMLLARLQRATEREGLRPDIDHAMLIDQVSGPIYYRILITGAPTDRGYAERLVSAVLEGVLPPPYEWRPTPRRQGNVGPGVRGHAEGLQATVENLAAEPGSGGEDEAVAGVSLTMGEP
jgi:AcrR family transcriptional regulator